MQPVLTIATGAVAFATTVWIVYRVLRSVFPTASQSFLGVGLISAAIWLLFFRLFAVSLFLLILGAATLVPRDAAKPRRASPRKSRVRSAHLEMTLDHESGDIDGRILCGPREGQFLSDLLLPELLQLLSEMQTDEQSLKLLETYLDRAQPDWRDHADRSAEENETPPPFANDMSREDAYRVLGLEPGSTEDDIREAFRRLIKRLHPDSGGSAVLTAQITAARDRLLGEP
ncbi:DnaJ domain-containing protein [Tropicimonas sp. IMCC6043]|uniref:J domain-containing protein n=1 Tax=Tropicimonas sp. IMCC6043 TaxID=2510645 RepID=UPI00101DBA93|nr:DnaJ domain-containing protein [Tropicimonas sp. IMCC6043]RYH06334.1 molecular chaperone DnaJ [Tropicimonas sp. IMCC6043]